MSAQSSSGLSQIEQIAKAAKEAFDASQLIDASERVKALYEITKELEALKDEIKESNRQDLEVCPPLDLKSSK
jgi:glutamate-5-semialdehyde dehydrogenase